MWPQLHLPSTYLSLSSRSCLPLLHSTQFHQIEDGSSSRDVRCRTLNTSCSPRLQRPSIPVRTPGRPRFSLHRCAHHWGALHIDDGGFQATLHVARVFCALVVGLLHVASPWESSILGRQGTASEWPYRVLYDLRRVQDANMIYRETTESSSRQAMEERTGFFHMITGPAPPTWLVYCQGRVSLCRLGTSLHQSQLDSTDTCMTDTS